MRFAHITLGKAGSQWIKDVLTDPDLFSLQTGLTFSYPNKGGTYGMPEFAAEPDNIFAGPIYHIRYEDWQRYRKPDDRCVVVVRDPRDSIVSWAFSIAYSHVTEEHVRIIRPALLALDLRGKLEIAMYTFWESAAAQRSWAGRKKTKNELVLKYEDLIADEGRGFRDILAFYGWTAPDAAIDTVVTRLSFATRSGRKPGEKQEFSHYRSGVAGDWRNYFDRSLGQRFEEACPGLLVDLGYETSNDWFLALPERIAALDEGALEASAGASQELLDLYGRRVTALQRLADSREKTIEDLSALLSGTN